jgi:formamidopyrimidine-DNA glycosylase
MPEGPEILFMIDSLQKFKNNNLNSIKIIGGRYKRHNLPTNFKLFNKNLPSKINHIKCKGKFIYIILENEWCIWITLGMTGQFVFNQFKRLYKYIYKIPLDSYNHQKKYLMLHSYPFKIYKKTITPKGEKVKKYKINNRSIFSIY